MAENDPGFSALDAHGLSPSLPPPIIAMAHVLIAHNAQAFREALPPPPASDQVGFNNDAGPAAEVEGVRNGSGGAPGGPQRRRKLGQCSDLDECTCGFRGKHKCRCFNPAKPHKYHFKMFCWNCSETGYCFAFYWYRGKEEARPAHVPATLWPVMKLVNNVVAAQPIVGDKNGYVLTTDNWYTSLHSALFLAQHGIHCCGTLRTNRVNSAAPPEGALFKKSGAPPRGTIKCHELEGRLVPPHWKVFLTAWVDNKPVHMLHSWPTMFDTCERNQKQQGAQEYRKQQFPRPTVCKNYNKSMGGTDLADFYLAEYATTHRAKRWQPKILFHCIQQAVVNAHIMCCSKNGVSNAQFPLLDFIKQLLQEIAPKPAPPAQDPCGYQPAVMSARNRS